MDFTTNKDTDLALKERKTNLAQTPKKILNSSI